MTPLRIQRSRAKGSKLPENTVCVTRGTRFGNPYRVGDPHPDPRKKRRPMTQQEAVGTLAVEILAFDSFMAWGKKKLTTLADIRALRGKNLACFCRLCAKHRQGKPFHVKCDECLPCHADVLGKLASG